MCLTSSHLRGGGCRFSICIIFAVVYRTNVIAWSLGHKLPWLEISCVQWLVHPLCLNSETYINTSCICLLQFVFLQELFLILTICCCCYAVCTGAFIQGEFVFYWMLKNIQNKHLTGQWQKQGFLGHNWKPLDISLMFFEFVANGCNSDSSAVGGSICLAFSMKWNNFYLLFQITELILMILYLSGWLWCRVFFFSPARKPSIIACQSLHGQRVGLCVCACVWRGGGVADTFLFMHVLCPSWKWIWFVHR